MNYHAVHHMHPRIPFHKLPAAFAAAAPAGTFKHVESRGYLYAHATVLRAALTAGKGLSHAGQ
jgi:fatty acid desaturase